MLLNHYRLNLLLPCNWPKHLNFYTICHLTLLSFTLSDWSIFCSIVVFNSWLQVGVLWLWSAIKLYTSCLFIKRPSLFSSLLPNFQETVAKSLKTGPLVYGWKRQLEMFKMALWHHLQTERSKVIWLGVITDSLDDRFSKKQFVPATKPYLSLLSIVIFMNNYDTTVERR